MTLIDLTINGIEEAGCKPEAYSISASLRMSIPEEWRHYLGGWRELGVTHVVLNAIDAGLATPQEHMHDLGSFIDEVNTGFPKKNNRRGVCLL